MTDQYHDVQWFKDHPKCAFCGFRAKTWRRVSWHYLFKHPGLNKRFRGSLWKSR